MTHEEAIKYGNDCLNAWESWVKEDAPQVQFYKLAVEALKKQIPSGQTIDWGPPSPYEEAGR